VGKSPSRVNLPLISYQLSKFSRGNPLWLPHQKNGWVIPCGYPIKNIVGAIPCGYPIKNIVGAIPCGYPIKNIVGAIPCGCPDN